ncbi:MAG: hypothetical protein AAF267_21695, partial [Deinococcota bacterium]
LVHFASVAFEIQWATNLDTISEYVYASLGFTGIHTIYTLPKVLISKKGLLPEQVEAALQLIREAERTGASSEVIQESLTQVITRFIESREFNQKSKAELDNLTSTLLEDTSE